MATQIEASLGIGLSGSKPRIVYYEFAALWKEWEMEREDGQEDQ